MKSNYLSDFTQVKVKRQQENPYGYLTQLQWPEFHPVTRLSTNPQPLFFQPPQFSSFQTFHKELLHSHSQFIYPSTSFHQLNVFPPPNFPRGPFIIPITSAATDRTATESSRKKKEREPTTAPPFVKKFPKIPALLKENSQIPELDDLRNDRNLLNGVRKINPTFVIEDFVSVPARNVVSNTVLHTSKIEASQSNAVTPPRNELIQNVRQLKIPMKNKSISHSSKVKAEATGRTATSGNIPEIPFDSYFLPYLSQKRANGKIASLILEPHSKAVAGNGGTAISKPISRAVLKKGVPTNVFFNPESIAVAGVGGKAHAEAELELDLMSRR